MTTRDNRDYMRVLLYSYYTTITGWGVLLKYTYQVPLTLQVGIPDARPCSLRGLHSRKLTWKPKKGPIKTTVTLKWGYMGFHVNLGECRVYNSLTLDPVPSRSWPHGVGRLKTLSPPSCSLPYVHKHYE